MYPSWASNARPTTIRLIRPRALAEKWPKGDQYPSLQLQIKQFVPGPSDIVAERWRSGKNEVILELPPFAAFDNTDTTRALLAWVDDNFEYYARDMIAQGGDFVISATFDEALRYVSKNTVSGMKTMLKRKPINKDH